MKAILFDIDGVLLQQGEAIAGAAEVMRWVTQERIPHLFVTNTTSMSRQQLAERLSALGDDVDPQTILTPAAAALEWLSDHPGTHMLTLVPDAIVEEFEQVRTPLDSEAAGVILGDIGMNWNYYHLNHAFRVLMASPHRVLIALGMSRYYASKEGMQLDVGPFVKALEYATGHQALVMGKPASGFFMQAITKLGMKPNEALMVGDDVSSDVLAAQHCGLIGCLVRTGKYRPDDERGSLVPANVIDSVADLPTLWEQLQQ